MVFFLSNATLIMFVYLFIQAAVSDMLTMTIPNKHNALILLLFLATIMWVPMGWDKLLWSFAAASLTLIVGFLCFTRGWMGGGDVKFATVIVLCIGSELALSFALLASIYGGALTLFILFARKQALPLSLMKLPWLVRLHDKKTGIPYGIALSAAALHIFPQSNLFRSLIAVQ
jgi:prepilin peptidase CpaA